MSHFRAPIDIEKLGLPISWLPSFGNRAFAYDAFLSHRWNDDHSMKLLEILGAEGVFAWHDGDKGMIDCESEPKITRALLQSRCVVVCIDSEFRHSEWIRAEYDRSLECERTQNIRRVFVALLDEEATVPEELKNSPTFSCWGTTEQAEVRRLAAVLREANALDMAMFLFPPKT